MNVRFEKSSNPRWPRLPPVAGAAAGSSHAPRAAGGRPLPQRAGAPCKEVCDMEPMCPNCLNRIPAIMPVPRSPTGDWRCEGCNHVFSIESAFDAAVSQQELPPDFQPEPQFHLDHQLAAMELRFPEDGMR